MSIPIIVMGDKTSHGGTVITCSLFSHTHGRGFARVGDMVTCPRCKGIFPIAQGDASFIDDGRAVAYHGCKTACGATLIAGQQFTYTTPTSGDAPGAASSASPDNLLEGFGVIASGLAGTYQDERIDDTVDRFRGRFQLVDAATGEPVPGQAVRVRSTGGQYINGTTDGDGFTEWVEREAQEALAFDLAQDGAA